jgi:hypothetical protein
MTADGTANEFVNARANGYSNGHTNGHTNGAAEGSSNGLVKKPGHRTSIQPSVEVAISPNDADAVSSTIESIKRWADEEDKTVRTCLAIHIKHEYQMVDRPKQSPSHQRSTRTSSDSLDVRSEDALGSSLVPLRFYLVRFAHRACVFLFLPSKPGRSQFVVASPN